MFPEKMQTIWLISLVLIALIIVAIISAVISAVSSGRGPTLATLQGKCEELMQVKQIKGICPNTMEKLTQRIKEYEAM